MAAGATRWREAVEADDTTAIGRAPENRRQALVKLIWIAMWMLYLGSPVSDLADGGHGLLATVLGWTGLAVYVTLYLGLVFRRTNAERQPPWVYGVLGLLGALALVLGLTLGSAFLVLFVYLSVGCGAVLPGRQARWVIPLVTGVLALCAWPRGADGITLVSLLVPCMLGGFAMTGVRQLVRTTRELREARETIAQLAATEERLRLARDLHDLLGHSLSLITLKSELAGRMLPDRPGDAAAQVADIERVSRQALVDVREAVSGYRRANLADELIAARGALRTAGIRADLPTEVTAALTPEAEAALAWALREAVTNVVRHSGARRCAVAVGVGGGGTVCLTVSDDGRGPSGTGRGNGLTGLEERLLLAGGRLETEGGRGFTLRAFVPAGYAAAHDPGAAGGGPVDGAGGTGRAAGAGG
ncbi:sensor histidine kinase [Streptomyces sp. MI02-7b]|uniref:sensor histidine kinase n=1 Tax=Streptomyces sp. MI02-7b TaxID=462941 RepID=UPI0029B7B479|nr:histidine kinase [Streptomyces sp. MI02-7b]MDX3078126.1 histidine kinase [Streptomyces sp. MI02-7b]